MYKELVYLAALGMIIGSSYGFGKVEDTKNEDAYRTAIVGLSVGLFILFIYYAAGVFCK